MQIDFDRIEKYLEQITAEYDVINSILAQLDHEIIQSFHHIRSLKYSMIIVSEAIASTLQHILAIKHNVAISGYKEAFVKAKEYNLISSELLEKLQPFISFRNMLVHHYWKVDDDLFLKNLRSGLGDFQDFMKEINSLLLKYKDEVGD